MNGNVIKVKTFEERAVELLELMRDFENEFETELETFQADGLMSAATENFEAALKCIRYNPDPHDEGDNLPEHERIESRAGKYV